MFKRKLGPGEEETHRSVFGQLAAKGQVEENDPVFPSQFILHFSETVHVPELISHSEEPCEFGGWESRPHFIDENTEEQESQASA